MTEREPKEPHEALGQPPHEADPNANPDFAREHEETAVDPDVITDEDHEEREPESPHGWAGMQR